MSYLEIVESPLPDLTKAIISLWFRDPLAQAKPPPVVEWPLPPPPNTLDPEHLPAGFLPNNKASMTYFNPYGLPIPLFENFLLYPAPVTLPYPPPAFPTEQQHMLLAFGNPDQPYNYHKWYTENADVLDYVDYLESPVPGVGFVPEGPLNPPPYRQYNVFIGDEGKFKVVLFKVEDGATPKGGIVSQSFIGVSPSGYLTVCLQSNTRANYTGYAFTIEDMTNVMVKPSVFRVDGPPYSYSQIGWPWPDGHWELVSEYWDGYQFRWKDISSQIMNAMPEFFILGGPQVGIYDRTAGPYVGGKGWHHVLLSFDLSGSVDAHATDDSNSSDTRVVTTSCRGWLAVDDKNYTDAQLQRPVKYPDFWNMTLLPGMGGQLGGLFGTTGVHTRPTIRPPLGPNDIIPQSAFLVGASGSPRRGMVQSYDSYAGLSNGFYPEIPEGDFYSLVWSGNLWPLYGRGIAPGPWLAEFNPPRPNEPPPESFDLPQFSGGPFIIPCNGHPIGLPATTHHLKHNTGVELAELQIWSGKTIDTGDVNVRRLFVDKDGKAVPPATAAQVLGEPDILLHGTSNWQNGKNTGTLGIDSNGKLKSTGQFKPMAKIDPFTPEPMLGK